ncbi:hypothetical protein DPMN_068862 [Dreissena polymorpha]|uniref:Uncharacterized protein n=1 Tax=Dreissena polymorpha TaxID=45954 RepID=A0A9D4BTX1_DREPO|nr:hypothetical protein DPMN_068862 [Dreissena polymorpha]
MPHPPPTGGHVFQATGTTFELVQNIIGTNLLTKFHDDRTINMASRVLTRKNAPPLGSHENCLAPWQPFFSPIWTIFKLIGDINENNVLTKFYDDWAKIVTSRVFTRNTAPPPGGHLHEDVTSTVFTSFKLGRGTNGTNVLTKFHEDQTINAKYKNAPPPDGHVFKATGTIFELVQDIIGTNLQTKFHDDRNINVASRVLTRKNAQPPGGHVFQPTGIIFKFDWTINMASRVLTRKKCPAPWQPQLIQEIIQTNLLTKFHEDWTINVASRENCPSPGGHVFSLIWTIFKLVRDINETNVLTKFHDYWAKILTSRVFTRNTAPPPGGHLHEDWASNVTSTVFTSFELNQTINVASIVFTRQIK